jgi:alginate O-acetyltransferase complex protein AlgI
MAFCSLKYLLFLAAVTAVYYLLPQRLRCPFLLLASYVFYASFSPAFCLLLLAATAVSWGCARASARRLLGRDTLWIVLGAL